MKKKAWIIIGFLLVGLAGVAGMVLMDKGLKVTHTHRHNLAVRPGQTLRGILQDDQIVVKSKGNMTHILSRAAHEGRMPFFLDENSGEDDRFYFMFYDSDETSYFYSYSTALEDTKTPCRMEFAVDGNIESGAVVNDGQGLIYREMANGSDVNGSLCYMKKDGSTSTLVNHCLYYCVSPDKKRVIAAGNVPLKIWSWKKKFYIFNLDTNASQELKGVPCPQSPEDADGVEVKWNANSGYFYLMGRLLDASGMVKQDFTSSGEAVNCFNWSPDGQRLAYLIQSESGDSKFGNDAEGTDISLSDQIGIYNILDKSNRFYKLNDALALDLIWGEDGQSLVLKTISSDNAESFQENHRPDQPALKGSEQFNLLKLNMVKATIEMVLQDVPLNNVYGLYDGNLLYTYYKGNHSYVALYDTVSKATHNFCMSDSVTPYYDQGQLILGVASGLYLVDATMQLSQLYQWDQNYPVVWFKDDKTMVFCKNDRIEVLDLSMKL